MGSRRRRTSALILSTSTGWSRTSTPLICIRLAGSSIRSQAWATGDTGSKAGAGWPRGAGAGGEAGEAGEAADAGEARLLTIASVRESRAAAHPGRSRSRLAFYLMQHRQIME